MPLNCGHPGQRQRRGAVVSVSDCRLSPHSEPQPRSLRVRGKGAILGVPGLTMCPDDLPAPQPVSHIVKPGSPGRRDEINFSGPGGGRRRPIGGVAAFE